MNQKIYTRQVRIPRRNRPLTAKDIQKYVKADLTQGEELLQVALTSVEATHYVVEIGIQKR
ncbi:MAG: hypothetical protein ACAI44_40075 [Candidatus Sericytochromatia bacterium]